MYQICVFAGTTEGRRLAEFLGDQPVRTTVCVATEYGGEMIPPQEGVEVRAGRMLPEELLRFLQEGHFDLVIDATHPYATSITENIRKACDQCKIPRHRVGRSDSGLIDVIGVVYVANAAEAVEYLKHTEGNILLTTGSKELPVYAQIPEFAERVYARVLPMESSLEACSNAGLSPSHIIAMQGPFSEELNVAMLESISAKWMVTKDGGNAGGFEQKVRAAQRTGTSLVVIGRPEQSDGASLGETIRMLCDRFGCVPKWNVQVVGIGPGEERFLTQEAGNVIRRADCLIGAGRMLQTHADARQGIFEAVSPEKICGFIEAHPEYPEIAVLMSGDIGFFSGAKKLLPMLSALKGCRLRVVPGISSLVYLCARLGTGYEDVVPVSLHGRTRDIAGDVQTNARVFALVGGENGMQELCRQLVEAGLGDVRISIGERLSYPDEKITVGTAEALAEGSYHSLSVALIEHEGPSRIVTPGIPDEAFLRGQGARGIVPMTKSEVRAILLSKLQLRADSICWDIGAGTGSVAIEMARMAPRGQVYAIEKEPDAVELIRENMARFHVDNVIPINGLAPEALESLPAPTHVFIGGSGSRMRPILSLILQKNPQVRIVATAIALETIGELTACSRELPFRETQAVAVNIARDKQAGEWHLMMSQNPVYIYTMQGGDPIITLSSICGGY